LDIVDVDGDCDSGVGGGGLGAFRLMAGPLGVRGLAGGGGLAGVAGGGRISLLLTELFLRASSSVSFCCSESPDDNTGR
jgi:hypothetical protein